MCKSYLMSTFFLQSFSEARKKVEPKIKGCEHKRSRRFLKKLKLFFPKVLKQ